GASDNGRIDKPLCLVSPHQRVEGEDATLAFVVSVECEINILYRSDQGKRPDDARQPSDNKLFIYGVLSYDGLEHIQGRGSDVAIYDAQRDKDPGRGQLLVAYV